MPSHEFPSDEQFVEIEKPDFDPKSRELGGKQTIKQEKDSNQLFKASFDTQKEYLEQFKTEVLEQFENKLRMMTLTEKQIQAVFDSMNDNRFYADVDIKTFLSHASVIPPRGLYDNGRLMKIGESAIDIKAVARNSFGTNRPSIKELMDESFNEVHSKTLESLRARHEDSLKLTDLDLSVQEIMSAVLRLKDEIAKFRKNDFSFEYDKRIIEAWLYDLLPDTFDCFAKPFLKKYKENEDWYRNEKIERYNDRKFFEPKEDETNETLKTDLRNGSSVMDAIIESFSPDVLEMNYGMLYELVDREYNRRHPWKHPSKFMPKSDN